MIAEYFQNKRDGFFVEVGAYDGVEFSNTYYFEKLGWQGILVEADPELAESCRRARPGAKVVQCAAVQSDCPSEVDFEVVEGWKALSSLNVRRHKQGEDLQGEIGIQRIKVPAKTLDAILTECQAERIDFITVDVEGDEWGVLAGLSVGKWRPQLIIVERSTTVPDRRIMSYMHSNGYRYLRTTGSINDWFILSAKRARLPYHIWLFATFVLPRLCLAYLVYPVKRLLKLTLARLGLLEMAREIMRGRGTRS